MNDYNRFIRKMAEEVYPEERKEIEKKKEQKDKEKDNER